MLHSSSNVRQREMSTQRQATVLIDGPSAEVPLFALKPVSNMHTFAPAPPSGKSDSNQETNPRCREERPSRNSKLSSGDFSASHLAATGLVKKSASWSAVPTFTTFDSPLLTLSCNHRKRVETCLWRPRPRLVAKPLAALESVRIFRVNLGQTPHSQQRCSSFHTSVKLRFSGREPNGFLHRRRRFEAMPPKRSTSPEDDRRLTKSPAKSASTHPFSSFAVLQRPKQQAEISSSTAPPI